MEPWRRLDEADEAPARALLRACCGSARWVDGMIARQPFGDRPTLQAAARDIWFALDEGRPLACFAGIWTNWTSVRKVKEGETTNDLYAFLTTVPNAEDGAIHPKAMPVILTTQEEVET